MISLTRPAAASIAALTLLIGAACSSNSSSAPTSADTGASGAKVTQSTPTASTQVKKTTGELSTQDLVKLAEPSVVRIATTSGVGTGFIVDAEGYIVTNNHVVQSSSGRNWHRNGT